MVIVLNSDNKGEVKLSNRRLHVGRFSISDHKTVLNISGSVELGPNFIDSLFFLALDSIHNEDSITIKLNSIEMRALSLGCRQVALSANRDHTHFKESGGRGKKSQLKVYSNDKYEYIGIVKGKTSLQVSFKVLELLALSQEISNFIEVVSRATYKTQQFVEKKKIKKKKNDKNNKR